MPTSLYGDELGGGAIAGAYVVEHTIAAGGWGTVYLARHRELARLVALKVLHRDLAAMPRHHARFLREARLVNAIRHPNIVDIYDLGRLPDGRPYLVMELLDGDTLEAHLAAAGHLSVDDTTALIAPLCSALAAAHAHGVVHRDLKPSNVHLGRHAGQVKLLDFGIAKFLEPEDADGARGLTSTTTRLGTPDCMAPEQVRGEAVDPRADVYGLGVLLYRTLTGVMPFVAESVAELERLHLEAPPRPLGAWVPLDRALDAVVLRCLEKRPEARFSSVADLDAAWRDATRRGAGSRA